MSRRILDVNPQDDTPHRALRDEGGSHATSISGVVEFVFPSKLKNGFFI